MLDFYQPFSCINILNAEFSRQQGQYVCLLRQHEQSFVAKLLKIGAGAEVRANFQHELKVYQQLRHQGFCPPFSIYQLNDFALRILPVSAEGQILILPYLQSLEQYCNNNASLEYRISLFLRVCIAVQAMHQTGFIHGDLKYAHITLQDQQVKIIDYAQARQMNLCSPTLISQPVQSNIIATPSYMAPELFQGELTSVQTDLYALGIIFYELVVRKKPFTASCYRDWAIAHCQTEIPVLPHVLSSYQHLLDGMLAKRQENRYQEINSVINVLNLIQKQQTNKSG